MATLVYLGLDVQEEEVAPVRLVDCDVARVGGGSDLRLEKLNFAELLGFRYLTAFDVGSQVQRVGRPTIREKSRLQHSRLCPTLCLSYSRAEREISDIESTFFDRNL